MNGVEHQAGAPDERLKCGGRAAGRDRVLRLEQHVGLEPDRITEEVAEPAAPAQLVREPEGGVVTGIAAEGAGLELSGVLGSEIRCRQHDQDRQHPEASHASPCASRRLRVVCV